MFCVMYDTYNACPYEVTKLDEITETVKTLHGKTNSVISMYYTCILTHTLES